MEEKFKVSAHIKVTVAKETDEIIAKPIETILDKNTQHIIRLFQYVKAEFETQIRLKAKDVKNIRISAARQDRYVLNAQVLVEMLEFFSCSIEKEIGNKQFELSQFFEQFVRTAREQYSNFEEIVYIRVLAIDKADETTGNKK